MLSVCTTTKERWPHLARFLDVIRKTGDHEIVVADWHSTDWPQDMPQLGISQVVQVDAPGFSRGHGMNAAARAARGDVLLFADCDLVISGEVMARGVELAEGGSAFFPLIEYEQSTGGDYRAWPAAYGCCFMLRDHFDRVGGFDEWWSYGYDDVDMLFRLRFLLGGKRAIRENIPGGVLHPWHEDSARHRHCHLTKEEREADRARQVACFERDRARWTRMQGNRGDPCLG